MSTTTSLVRQDQLATTRRPPTTPRWPRVRSAWVESFALTANNITYAALGDMLNYWQVLPTGEAGLGHRARGALAQVQSLHLAVAVGERTVWLLAHGQPGRAVARARQPLTASATAPRTARACMRSTTTTCAPAPTGCLPRRQRVVQALLRHCSSPRGSSTTFITSSSLAPAHAASSASSKTAYGTAFQLRSGTGIEVIGLTSPGNVAFCESLGCYHRVVTYDALDQIDGATPACTSTLRQRRPASASTPTSPAWPTAARVGASHVGIWAAQIQLPGPRPVMFFCPAPRSKAPCRLGRAGPRTTGWWQPGTSSAPPCRRATALAGGAAPRGAPGHKGIVCQRAGGQRRPTRGHIADLLPG